MKMYIIIFIVNENRKQEKNHSETGEAEATRLLAGTKTETDEAYSKRVGWETHQRPPQGHGYIHHPEEATKPEVKSNEEDSVYLKLTEWVYFPDIKGMLLQSSTLQTKENWLTLIARFKSKTKRTKD